MRQCDLVSRPTSWSVSPSQQPRYILRRHTIRSINTAIVARSACFFMVRKDNCFGSPVSQRRCIPVCGLQNGGLAMDPKSYRFLNLGLDIRALQALNIEGVKEDRKAEV